MRDMTARLVVSKITVPDSIKKGVSTVVSVSTRDYLQTNINKKYIEYIWTIPVQCGTLYISNKYIVRRLLYATYRYSSRYSSQRQDF